ncbi:acetate--CoA ligase [Arenicella xantha]|uniref:Acetyl-coenzyme A synthetase n=1 Tax=Arenicella xantha TaxID=644221 RepID=A0A395JLL6_9GAMM|nr:acetate--CoA ligase [Arenicella xantha]RBP51315.1 acetyl-coenzyme A synthetase [Arenicella xantha]
MSEAKIYPVFESIKATTHLTQEQYQEKYRRSLDDSDGFWAEQAEEHLDWFERWDQVSEFDFHKADIKWFSGGKLNVSVNCIDRHLPERANQTAIIWEGDDPNASERISYQELHDNVCQLANALRELGIKKGDRVCLYMPMIPEAIYSMLACTRVGAVHSVVFGGFSPEALRGRINDSECKLVITADEGLRGAKPIPLKANVDKACEETPSIEHVLVCKVTGNQVGWQEGRDIDYQTIVAKQATQCEPEVMDAEDPMFILYTSGSTGTPKGVLHTTGGYLLTAAMTFKYVFDYQEGEVYWCTADIGWVTGHTYLTYGPLCNGATTLVFEGVPTYPDASRFWQVVDKHQVNIFYTAPTALRALMGAGDEFLENTSRSSIRILGTVGEPINPEAWEWYFHKVGHGKCPIVDTWWQTETGGTMLVSMPGATATKPGSAGLPFFGVELVLLDDEGQVLEGAASGNLAIPRSWPGQMRGVYNNPKRFYDAYFSMYPGYYFTGDGCRRDEDGYYWITGRVDDVINVSGHRMGTAEVESALVLHETVSEAAVVGYPHDIKGQGIYAYVTLMSGQVYSDALKAELIKHVRSEIGPVATPDIIHWAPGLPKTRSGKIMRRILRKIAEDDFSNLGDISTLADPGVVEDLTKTR